MLYYIFVLINALINTIYVIFNYRCFTNQHHIHLSKSSWCKLAVDQRSLSKLFQICQKTNSLIVELTKNQTRLEGMVKEQNIQISELLKKLDTTETEYDSKARGKGKKKINTIKPFYRVKYTLFIIYFVYSILIYIYFFITTGCYQTICDQNVSWP